MRLDRARFALSSTTFSDVVREQKRFLVWNWPQNSELQICW